MPVTGWMFRDITFCFLLSAGPRQRAGSIHDEARAFPIERVARDLARLPVDLDGDARGISQHHAQRWTSFDALHAAGRGHVVEQALAARIVDFDPAVVGECE